MKSQRELWADKITVKERILMDDLTCVGTGGLDNIANLLKACSDQKLEGAFVECGVWRGGSCLYARHIMNVLGMTGVVCLCDSFKGNPAPEPDKYPLDKGDVHHTHTALKVSLPVVLDSFRRFKLEEGTVIVEGWFEETLPVLKNKIGEIIILRSDGDLFSSTIQTLESLYDNVVKGGFVIFNNWLNKQVRAAGEQFREQHNITTPLFFCDNSTSSIPNYGIAYWQKEEEAVIPPKDSK